MEIKKPNPKKTNAKIPQMTEVWDFTKCYCPLPELDDEGKCTFCGAVPEKKVITIKEKKKK